MKTYLIPGLGADARMYTAQLQVFSNAQVLEHLQPVKNESLQGYARRLLPGIDTSAPFTLVGTSLGGIIAIELSQLIEPRQLILIATVKNRSEMPLFIRSMKYLNLHRLVNGNFYKRMNGLLVRRLANRRDSAAAQLITEMTRDARADFIQWAVNAVINWQPPARLRADVIHIHGTHDSLFPYKRIKNALLVKNAPHVLNMTHSTEVNELLMQVLIHE